MAAVATAERRHRVEAALDRHLLGAGQEHAVAGAVAGDGQQPPEEIAAAVVPRHAAGRAHRQVHPPTSGVQLLGELDAGLARADDQHGATGQRGRVAVGVRVSCVTRGAMARASGGTRGTW